MNARRPDHKRVGGGWTGAGKVIGKFEIYQNYNLSEVSGV